MRKIYSFFFLVFCVLGCFHASALIILGGDEGYTNAPPDDPGWDNVGYVRANWANVQSRASGVYIGDGWVLTAYHVLYYDAPTGIVFNAEPNKAYPIDVESYIRLDTTNFTRFADSSHWIDPRDYPNRDEWISALNIITTTGADLAMFQLTENPDIEPVPISEISKGFLPISLQFYSDEVTAIATGRPREEELAYWTTNLTEWAVGTDGPLTNAPYSGYYDYRPNVHNQTATWYQPICRWGENRVDELTRVYNMGSFGETACMRTTFTTNSSGVFQMARLDSGGGVFYKGTGQWALLGLLTAKALPDGTIDTNNRDIHPFGSRSLISDLSYYREEIMKVTEWPDLSLQMITTNETWLANEQLVEIALVTTCETGTALDCTNTLQVVKNGETNSFQFTIPSLAEGSSHTNTYVFTNDAPGTWVVTSWSDSENQILETYESNNSASKTFYAGPDLKIVSSSPLITNAVAGSTVNFDIQTKNIGNADATAPFDISLYRSTNDVFLTLSEPELQNLKITNVIINNLSVDTSTTNHLTTTVPSDVGTYYLRARVDSSNTVAEAIENNNWGRSCAIRVGPDLIIADSSPSTTNAASGSEVSIDVVTKNQGAAAATTNSPLGLYLVNLTTMTGMDDPVLTNIYLSAIPANSSVTNSITFTAPTNTGAYAFVAKADDDDELFNVPSGGLITEYDEGNNDGLSYQHYSVLYVGSDLTPSFATNDPLYASVGATVQIDSILQNIGGDPSLRSTNILQLGTSVWSPIATNVLNSIPAYSGQTNSFSFTTPSEPGTYYLRVIMETSDVNANNDASATIMLRIGPDLQISFTETNTLRAMAGANVTAFADVSNTGSGSGITITSILQLSTNNSFNTFSTVATNTVLDSTFNKPFKFKAPRDPGIYYLRAQTDPMDSIPEFNEYNNFSEILTLEVRPLAMPWLHLLLE